MAWPSDLRDGDPALLGQLLLGFLAGIRVGQVRVEVLVQHLRCLFVEVTPLASEEKEKKQSDKGTYLKDI